MRWSSIVLFVFANIYGVPSFAADPPATAPATQPLDAMAPAPTPGEALERVLHATTLADEDAYHRIVLIVSPHRYCEAYSRMTFAAFRLHNAIRDRGIKGERVMEEPGWDRNHTLAPTIIGPPPQSEWDNVRTAVRKIEWKISGNTAEPLGAAPWLSGGGTAAKMSLARMTPGPGNKGGWVIVIADPVRNAQPEQLRKYAESWFAAAAVLDAAAAGVKNGELKTIREINDFLEARRPPDPTK